MKHASSRAVFAYWNEQRGMRAAPARGDIDPAAIPHALGDTIMLAADFNDELRFRLAGTRICALFGREIKGEAFSALWNETSSEPIANLLSVVTDEKIGAVAGVSGHTADGESTDLELLLLPLAQNGHPRVRTLGVLAPLVLPYWLGEKPIIDLTLGTVRHMGGDLETSGMTAPREWSSGGRQMRHGFVVYEGGRAPTPGERGG